MGCAASTPTLVQIARSPTVKNTDSAAIKVATVPIATKERENSVSAEGSEKTSPSLDPSNAKSGANSKTGANFPKSMSFSLGIGLASAPPSASPLATAQDSTASGKLDDSSETMVSLFGDLYKIKQSTGSLECVGRDEKLKIVLVTCMDDEPDVSPKLHQRIITAEPEELSDTESSVMRPSFVSRNSASPVPSLDVTKPENVALVGYTVSFTSIKYGPPVQSEKGSLMSSQKASLYQDSPKHSRTGSLSLARNNPQQAQAVIAAMEAGNARRATLKKDNTFSGQPSSDLDMAPRTSLRKATTVHQGSYFATQRSKRAQELEADFDEWAKSGDSTNLKVSSNESAGFIESIEEGIVEESSCVEVPIRAEETV